MALLKSLEIPFATASVSIFNHEYLYIQHFIPMNIYDEIGVPVLKQHFKDYKIFYKLLKSQCAPTEFIFVINKVKTLISSLNDRVLEYAGRDEYWSEYPFDYDLVVKFIERYISLFKHYNSEILYQYELDLQKELFLKRLSSEERFNKIKRSLENIYFREKYGKPNAIFLLGNYDFGTIQSIKQEDAKKFYETEILKEEYQKFKDPYFDKKEYFIDSTVNSIEWNGTQTELIELLKALIENGSIKGDSQKNIFKLFTKFLNIDIKYPDKLITDIKKRNNHSETLFLDKLKTTLYNYIQIGNTR